MLLKVISLSHSYLPYIGSAERTEMQDEIIYVDYSSQVDRLKLDESSELYGKLCNMN